MTIQKLFVRSRDTSGTEVEVTAAEAKDVRRLQLTLSVQGRCEAQKEWDIWARSSPTNSARGRRIAVAKALGLEPVVRYL